MLKHRLIRLYKRLLVRRKLYPLHKKLLTMSLWGLGILNSENDTLSGEGHFIRFAFPRRKDITVLDVGANVGEYADRVMKFYPQAHVHAVEPHPTSFERLARQAALHGYQAYRLAFSDTSGPGKLYDNRESVGSEHASMYPEVITELHHATAGYTDVIVTTVDQFVVDHDIRHIDLLKIDTEGNELRVLQGSSKTIEAGHIDVIQFEFNEMNVVSRVFIRDLMSILPQYAFHRMLPDGLVKMDDGRTFVREVFAFQNIVALKISSDNHFLF